MGALQPSSPTDAAMPGVTEELALGLDGNGDFDGRRRFYLLLLVPVLAILAGVTLLPICYLVVTSLTPLSLTNPLSAWNFSHPAGNYILLATDARLHQSLWTQAKLSIATVALQMLIGLGAALLVHRETRRPDLLRTLFLVPMVLPPIVVAIIWKVLYSPDISPFWWLFHTLGLAVPAPTTSAATALTAIVVADTWEWFPFTMLIILAALKTLPEEMVEAAHVDGASRWQMFLFVTLPHIRHALLVAGLFRLIDSIKAFPLIYILTEGGPGNVTEVTNYYTFTQAFGFSYIGYSSAITVLLVLLVIALSVAIVRIVEGRATA